MSFLPPQSGSAACCAVLVLISRLAWPNAPGYYFSCAAQAAVLRRDAAVNAGLLPHPLGNHVELVTSPHGVHGTVLGSEYYGDLPKVVFAEAVSGSFSSMQDMQFKLLLVHCQQIESKVRWSPGCVCVFVLSIVTSHTPPVHCMTLRCGAG